MGDFDFYEMGGKDAWPVKLKTVAITPGFRNVEKVGLIRDADDDPEAAFQSVCDALRSSNLPVPQAPMVPAVGNVTVTVLIVPSRDENGCLEDLCLRSVASDPIMPCIDDLFSCIGKNALQMPDHVSKARLQTFIALKPGACRLLGEAADAHYWPWSDESLDEVCQFLRAALA